MSEPPEASPSPPQTPTPPTGRARRLWLRFLPLAAFACLAAAFFMALMRPATDALPSRLIGVPAPAFALPSLKEGGGEITLESFKGEGPALVNFFASWCPPCHAEHPELMRLAASGEARVYGVSYKDAPADTLNFLEKLGDPFREVAVDQRGRTAIDWGVSGAPESFVLSPEGVVAYRHFGPINPGDLDRLILPALRKAAQGR